MSTPRPTVHLDLAGVVNGVPVEVEGMGHWKGEHDLDAEIQEARLEKGVILDAVSWNVNKTSPVPLGSRTCAWTSSMVSDSLGGSSPAHTRLEAGPRLPAVPGVLRLEGERLPYSAKGRHVRTSLRRELPELGANELSFRLRRGRSTTGYRLFQRVESFTLSPGHNTLSTDA